jgi:hypothetical protein
VLKLVTRVLLAQNVPHRRSNPVRLAATLLASRHPVSPVLPATVVQLPHLQSDVQLAIIPQMVLQTVLNALQALLVLIQPLLL